MFPAETQIVVVEDSEVMGTMIVRELNAMGYVKVVLELRSAEALQKIKDFQEKLPVNGLIVFSDWNMPEVTGVDLLKQVRAEPKTAKTPFILVTTESEKMRVIEALRAGATGYLVKPFSKDQLRATVEGVWNRIQSTPPSKAAA